jgi:hypothetical protein
MPTQQVSHDLVQTCPRDVITCPNLPAWRHYSASLLLTPPHILITSPSLTLICMNINYLTLICIYITYLTLTHSPSLALKNPDRTVLILVLIWHLYFHTKSIHNYKYMLFHGDVHLTNIKYINIGKTKVLIKICTCNIWIYEMRDINSLRDCSLDIWTGMLFHKIAPL